MCSIVSSHWSLSAAWIRNCSSPLAVLRFRPTVSSSDLRVLSKQVLGMPLPALVIACTDRSRAFWSGASLGSCKQWPSILSLALCKSWDSGLSHDLQRARLYGYGTWGLTAALTEKLCALHRRHLRVTAGYRWPKRIRNEAIYHLTDTTIVSHITRYLPGFCTFIW